MLTFGLVVEGLYDEAVLKELIQKCASTKVEVTSRICNSRENLMKMFPTLLENFRGIVKAGTNIDKALVIRDADLKDPEVLINRMQSRISNRTYPFLVKPLVAVQKLEAWLLGDESALSTVTGKRVARVQNPEKLQDPKERLNKVLSAAKISYTPQVARKIAASVRIETIESRCPSFKEFRQAVLDC
jgi:hypothetical protein